MLVRGTKCAVDRFVAHRGNSIDRSHSSRCTTSWLRFDCSISGTCGERNENPHFREPSLARKADRARARQDGNLMQSGRTSAATQLLPNESVILSIRNLIQSQESNNVAFIVSGKRQFASFPNTIRDVAQPGSALHWGCRGRRFKSCRPDLNPKQLVASTCGELFLVWCERVTGTTTPDSGGSNRQHFRGPQNSQLLESNACQGFTAFKSCRHFR